MYLIYYSITSKNSWYSIKGIDTPISTQSCIIHECVSVYMYIAGNQDTFSEAVFCKQNRTEEDT